MFPKVGPCHPGQHLHKQSEQSDECLPVEKQKPSWTYPGTDVGPSSFKNRLDLFLHEGGVVTHPHQDLGQVPLWLKTGKDIYSVCVCV